MKERVIDLLLSLLIFIIGLSFCAFVLFLGVWAFNDTLRMVVVIPVFLLLFFIFVLIGAEIENCKFIIRLFSKEGKKE